MEMSLMEQFANPEFFDSLSFGDKMAGAGITTLMGMGTTFVVLILLWGIIALMTKIMKTGTKKPEPAAPAAAATPSAAPTTQVAAAPADNSALIAVISAAIAAYEGSGAPASNFVVRKISRISGESTTWSNAGHADCIESRRF